MRLPPAFATVLLFVCTFRLLLNLPSLAAQDPTLPAVAVAAGAERIDAPDLVGVSFAPAFRAGSTVWIQVEPGLSEVSIPRFAAPIAAAEWLPAEKQTGKLEIQPEPAYWKIALDTDALGGWLQVRLDAPATLMSEIAPIVPAADGSIYLPAHAASTTGEKLRYEPQPFKNTVGYWTETKDYAEWSFKLDRPGRFNVAILQGCGRGLGGSVAQLSVMSVASDKEQAATQLDFEVEETGHFQNFRWRHLGELELTEAGEHHLKLRPLSIKRVALMDVRAIHLIRQP